MHQVGLGTIKFFSGFKIDVDCFLIRKKILNCLSHSLVEFVIDFSLFLIVFFNLSFYPQLRIRTSLKVLVKFVFKFVDGLV